MNGSVLFLCTGNSCRSQMAEGWLRHLAGSRFEVASAGTQPVGLNPHAVRVMKDIGIDISRHHSKRVDELSGVRFDHVITVCDRAKESCPTLPGAKSLMHWSFVDPAEAEGSEEDRLNVFRQVRDAIGARIKEFLHNVAPE
jgi:arsenate reductase (thioredoxin)